MYFKAGNHKQAGLSHGPFKAIISPRPIGWISSCDEDGIANLAPYSFFNAISEMPPMVMFVSAPDARKDPDAHHHNPKDSLVNIRRSGEFGVNIVSQAQSDAMVATSAMLAPQIDEFTSAGLSKMPARDISAPLVAGAPAHLECRVHDMIDLPGTENRAGCVMVLGLVISMHIDDAFIQDGKLDVSKYQPVARLGYKDYATITEVYEMAKGLK